MADYDRKVYPYMPNSYPTYEGNSSLAIIPYGEVTFNASDRNPVGMLICDGEIYDKGAYPDLYYALGTNFNAVSSPAWTNTSVGANDFKVPNLIAAFPQGGFLGTASGTNTINTTTNSGGAASVALTAANIASHKHTVPFRNAGVSYNGGSSYAPAENQGSTLSDGTIYNNSGTSVTTAGANGAPFSIIPPYMALTPLVRADYSAQSTYQIGYVNVTLANNRFWCRLTWAPSGLYTGIVTIVPGAYTPAQFITAINNAISAFVLASPLVLTTILMGYSYSGTGRYVFKIRSGNSLTAIEFDFTTQFGTTIPQANLDLCADLMGYYTRTYAQYNGSNNPPNYYRIDNTGGSQSYIAPPKPMKIYYGSIADGTMTAGQLTGVTNSF